MFLSCLPLFHREEFVDAFVSYAFNTSVQSVFQEFARGFFLVCDPALVKLFRPEELQGVLVGKEIYDWAKLKQVQTQRRFSNQQIYNFHNCVIWLGVFFTSSRTQFMNGRITMATRSLRCFGRFLMNSLKNRRKTSFVSTLPTLKRFYMLKPTDAIYAV